MSSSIETTYASTISRDADNTSNMVAPGPPGPPPRDAVANDAGVFALVNTASSDPSHNPYKLWDGTSSTLAPFLAELDIALSAHDSTLYTFAVEFYAMLSNGKTILSFPGQAAQLDGAMPRPIYTWDNPAPADAASYGVDFLTVVEAVHGNYRDSLLRNPSLPADLPLVPAGTPYPVDKSLYVVSAAMCAQYDQRLRSFVLDHITSDPVKYDLARRFRGGRDLLGHLRAQSLQPLSSSEVRSILDDIDKLTAAGLAGDTEDAFTAYLVCYDRLLRRIPAINAARDTPATSAMRFVQAVVHGRPEVAQAIATNLRAGGVDQNDPTAVATSLKTYLRDVSHMRRLCQTSQAAAANASGELTAELISKFQQALSTLAMKPDPNSNVGKQQSTLDSENCDHADKGAEKWHTDKLAVTKSKPTEPPSEEDQLALINAALTELASRPDNAPLVL